MKSQTVDVEEWRELFIEAREMGLTAKEVEIFLKFKTRLVKTPVIRCSHCRRVVSVKKSVVLGYGVTHDDKIICSNCEWDLRDY
jgi:formylmethanofuran dehydrogenase subunit E